MARSDETLRLTLALLPDRLAICRLDPDATLPAWLPRAPIWFAARTTDELSLVVPEGMAAERWRRENGFRAFAVEGPLDFGLTGVLAELSGALAAAGVSLFAVSTFDTDYLLVRDRDVERAREAWAERGHDVL